MKFLIVLHNIGVMCGFVSIKTQYSLMVRQVIKVVKYLNILIILA